MKIVVLSDTHIPKRAKALPDKLLQELRTADQIIHAGDWQTVDVYERLKQYAPVIGVYGNTDGEDIRRIMPEKVITTIHGWKIGVVHGHGQNKTTIKRVQEAFVDKALDCIIFGHSHIPYLKYVNKTLLFNPGSATDRRKVPYFSFGLITFRDVVSFEHVFYADR